MSLAPIAPTRNYSLAIYDPRYIDRVTSQLEVMLATVLVIVFLLSVLALLASLAGAVFLKGRRKKSLVFAMVSLGTTIVSAVVFSNSLDAEAKSQGFEGFVDRSIAKDAGYENPIAWAEVREGYEAKRSAEILQQVAVREADKLAAAEQKSAEASAQTAEELQCRADLVCWGDKHVVWAGFKCPAEIEKLATYRANWLDGWLEGKFTHYRWLNEDDGTVTVIGDSLEFENGFGAATNMVYECDIDPVAETVLAVRAFAGRL